MNIITLAQQVIDSSNDKYLWTNNENYMYRVMDKATQIAKDIDLDWCTNITIYTFSDLSQIILDCSDWKNIRISYLTNKLFRQV